MPPCPWDRDRRPAGRLPSRRLAQIHRLSQQWNEVRLRRKRAPALVDNDASIIGHHVQHTLVHSALLASIPVWATARRRLRNTGNVDVMLLFIRDKLTNCLLHCRPLISNWRRLFCNALRTLIRLFVGTNSELQTIRARGCRYRFSAASFVTNGTEVARQLLVHAWALSSTTARNSSALDVHVSFEGCGTEVGPLV